jgi:hypothetical protein
MHATMDASEGKDAIMGEQETHSPDFTGLREALVESA